MSTVRTIDIKDYNAFRKFLQDACGILLGDNKQYLVTSRLNKIMAQHGMTTLGELIKAITSNPRSGLKEAVVDAMTTNETLWFRDIHPFNILQNQLLPELSKTLGAQQLKIWSAACSTGQEPYSISMVLDEFKQRNPGSFRAGERIVATDISSTVLNSARSGEYEMLALGRGLSQDRLTKFFLQTGDGRWAVKAPIKQRVDFRPMNLLHSYSMLGKFDIVFCRNVLIYFSADLKKDILTRIHGVLKPGGYLFLGASEALSNMPELYEMVQCRPGIIYRAK
ncbi:CheR family methyltransferase [Oceanospirillum linum]|uniref:Chemotaxis protein methyltransferase n=1 Tax=Oceanospirillum linum TaxID=966 RepID=A0A1T1HF52_OCELI|nr:protein-glutamate O-methyltransferase CheR [Oceanospirillum linum]OOV88508.1 chemotaxis protein [Oceanospirillum linum]SEF58685.1 MCP methyltransferase, CheR-type [Oleiphilus messinensis]SMP06480.1 MCP methyltransferase, CheR-type [Oceanospirillum linum]